MSIALTIEDTYSTEKSIFTIAFHADVDTFLKATQKIAHAQPGSFLTFSINHQNYCAAVGKNGEVILNPFRWDVSGRWANGGGGGAPCYNTEMDLLNHLVDNQAPIPFLAV
jgi:hypothetical protein